MRTILSSFLNHPLRYLAVCVLGILVLTMYPYNFFPRNKAAVTDGMVFTPPATAYTLHPHEALASLYQFTILIDCTPDVDDPHGGTGRILSSAKDFASQNFAIAQWHSSLNAQFFSRESHQFNEVTIPDVFKKGGRMWIAITFNGETLRCYINGVKKADRRTGPMALTQWDASYPLVMGTDPNGWLQWEGTLHAVAIYDMAFKGTELQKPGLILKKYSSIIHYEFDQGRGPGLRSTGTDTGSVYVPVLFKPYDKFTLFDTFHYWGKQRLYIRDIVANIFFFLPLGIFSAIAFGRKFHNKVAVFFFSMLVGLTLSVSVELLQIFLPSRYSSMFDVLSNTLGAAVGAIVWLLLSKKTAAWLTAGRGLPV